VPQGAAQGVDGLTLEAESNVGVDAGGDADVGVAEEFLDHDEVDPLFQEQGRSRVSKVVEADADATESCPAEEAAEAAGEVGRVERPSCGCGEDEALASPVRPCGLALLVLPLLVFLEGMETFGREGDAALGRSGLGGQMRETSGASALERAPDAGRSGGEVEVFPAEAEEFALAEASAEGEFVQRVQPVGAGGVEELAGLDCGEGSETGRPGCGGLDVASDVAGQLAFADLGFNRSEQQCWLRAVYVARLGRPGMSDEMKADLWRRWRAGESISVISRQIGKSPGSVFTVLKHHGGIAPAPRKTRSGSLTLGEREEISRGLCAGHSYRAIAGLLGRAVSTISREVGNNGGRDVYRATAAQERALDRARRPKQCLLAARRRSGRRY